MMHATVLISIVLAVFGLLNIGVYLFQTMIDLLGYLIYLGVFASPAVYFFYKMNQKTEKSAA